MLGPFVAELRFGADHAEVVAGDQVAIDAELMVDVEQLDVVIVVEVEVEVDFAVVGHQGTDFDPEIAGIVPSGGGRGGKRSDRGSREQVPSHCDFPLFGEYSPTGV